MMRPFGPLLSDARIRRSPSDRSGYGWRNNGSGSRADPGDDLCGSAGTRGL